MSVHATRVFLAVIACVGWVLLVCVIGLGVLLGHLSPDEARDFGFIMLPVAVQNAATVLVFWGVLAKGKLRRMHPAHEALRNGLSVGLAALQLLLVVALLVARQLDTIALGSTKVLLGLLMGFTSVTSAIFAVYFRTE